MFEPPKELISALGAVLAAGPPLRLAVLFGSAVRRPLPAGSDVDVAILPLDGGLALAEEAALQAELERALRRPVDLVRLDRASTFLGWQIARTGLPLLTHDPVEWPRFVARSASAWCDFGPAMEDAARRFQRRLAEEPKR